MKINCCIQNKVSNHHIHLYEQTDFNAMNYWHRIDEFAILIGFVSSGLARQSSSSAPFFLFRPGNWQNVLISRHGIVTLLNCLSKSYGPN